PLASRLAHAQYDASQHRSFCARASATSASVCPDFAARRPAPHLPRVAGIQRGEACLPRRTKRAPRPCDRYGDADVSRRPALALAPRIGFRRATRRARRRGAEHRGLSKPVGLIDHDFAALLIEAKIDMDELAERLAHALARTRLDEEHHETTAACPEQLAADRARIAPRLVEGIEL